MKPSVLFIFPNFAGHLNKSTLLAKYYEKQGATVSYLISGESEWFKASTNFNVITTRPLQLGFKPNTVNETKAQYFSGTSLPELIQERQQSIIQVIDDVKPSLIFIDEFCSLDYILAFEKVKNIKCITLVHTLPNEPDRMTPPLDSALKPNKSAQIRWILKRMKLSLKDYIYSFRNPQQSVRSVIKQLKNSGETTSVYHFYANRFPVIDGLERWYLSAPEFEFNPRNILPNSRYMGPMIDFDRNEPMKPRIQMFLNKIENTQDSKFIYCGLGTVIRSYVPDEHLLNFYQLLNEIALKNPHWHILVSVPNSLYSQIKPNGMNIMFVEYVPQLSILPKANVFITHGGGSVLEALYFGVPMLCFPPDSKVDYPGNAARIRYHGLGQISSFREHSDEIEKQLTELIENPVYRNNCARFAEIFNSEYSTDYLDRLNLPKA